MFIKRLWNMIRNINYLSKHSLWDDKEQLIVYLTNKILNDASYEFDLEYKNKKHLSILDTDETMDLLERENVSFIRTGDGEISLMRGENHSFQCYEKEVADRLIEALEKPKKGLLVGLNRNYFIPLMPVDNPFYYRRNAYEFRKFYLKHCSPDTQYISAVCTSYFPQIDSREKIEKHMNRWRRLFQDKNLVIVCGENLLDDYEYDVFELAKSKSFIYGPRVNAWTERKRIFEQIEKLETKDQVLVFILGQAGKAMITELVDKGYICWDVGHLAKYYNAFMTNMEWNEENIAKFYAD